MRPVNLLPRDQTRRSVRSTTVAGVAVPGVSPLALAALAALVLIGALLALATVRERTKVDERRERLAAVQKELAATPAPVQNAAGDAAAARLTAFASAAAARIAWDGVLRDVSRVLPEDAWLETLAARAPTASGSTAAAPGSVPTAFTANGYTYSQKAVARVLTRLALVPALTNVQLQSSVATDIGDRRVVKFTVLADIDPAEATS